MDVAIIHKTEEAEETDSRLLDLSENYVKVDEIPFDFTRRRLTTVVQDKKRKDADGNQGGGGGNALYLCLCRVRRQCAAAYEGGSSADFENSG